MKLYCQNPLCHEDKTKDRLRGIGDNKLYTTRKASHYYNEYWKLSECKAKDKVPMMTPLVSLLIEIKEVVKNIRVGMMTNIKIFVLSMLIS